MNANLRYTVLNGTPGRKMEEKGGIHVDLSDTKVRTFLGAVCVIGRKVLKICARKFNF
jgi:hypothetical protein